MTVPSSSLAGALPPPERYPAATRDRAWRAVRCAPFTPRFYQTLRDRSVSLGELVGSAAVERGFVAAACSQRRADAAIAWLIQVGVLRREVDGQGITDAFRLTPLGGLTLATWEQVHPTQHGDQHDNQRNDQHGDQRKDCWKDRWRDSLLDRWERWVRLPF